MRYFLFLSCVLLANPASAITYLFETLDDSAAPGVSFEARLQLSDDTPFFVDVFNFGGSPPFVDVSSNFQRLDLRIDDNGDGTDLVLTPLDFSSSEEFDDFTLTDNFFEYLGFLSIVFGGSSGGLSDLWTLDFQSDQFFFETRTLIGRFNAVSVPEPMGLALIGLGAIIGIAGYRSGKSRKR